MIRYLISVDPGVQGSGVCFWVDGKLVEAQYRSEAVDWQPTAVVVCEQMKVYPGARFAADLLDVAFAAGRVCAFYPNTIKVPAAEWKGQVPKKIHHERLKKNASPQELEVLGRTKVIPSLMHNVIDSYGLGKWYLDGKTRT